MKQLKKNLRFNNEMRLTIATAVSNAELGEETAVLHERTDVVTQEMAAAYFGRFNLTTETVVQLLAGVLPAVSKLLVLSGEGEEEYHLPMQKRTRLPFEVFESEAEAFTGVLTSELQATALKLVEDLQEHEGKHALNVDKLNEFFAGFTSPKNLVEAAPDFEKYFPDDYYEEVDEPEKVSIGDLLAA